MLSAPQILLGFASLAAIGVAYGPLVVEFSLRLWQRPHYQHAPFVLLALVLLYASRVGERGEAPPRRWLTWAFYALAAPLLAAGYWIPSPMLGVVSLILVLGAWGRSLAAASGARFPWGPWALLWLVVPPPLGLDGRLMRTLQELSSRLSSYTLDLLGVNHLMDGNALVLTDKQLFVDEACSGIVSVVSIVATAAMYGVWRRRGATHTLLLMALSAGWASLLNVVRIVSIALAWTQAGVDWAEGLPHTTLGLAIFGVSLAVLVANDWLLKAALAAIGPRWQEQTAEPLGFGRRLVAWWDCVATPDLDAAPAPARRSPPWGTALASLGLVPTLALAGLGASQFLLEESTVDEGAWVEPQRLVQALDRDGVMPDEVLGLRLVERRFEERGEGSVFGRYSVIYEYEDDRGRQFFVSCDLPFYDDWHDLSVCYVGIGWVLNERVVRQAPLAGADATYDYVQMDLTKPDGRVASVTFTAMGPDGSPRQAPGDSWAERLEHALGRRSRESVRRQTMQVQVLAERQVVVSAEDQQTAAQLLQAARSRAAEAARAIQ